MDRHERIAIGAAGAVMVVFFIALVYAAGGLGINVPTCVGDVAPFTTGQVIDKGEGHYEVHVVARMWGFDPPQINLPTGADVELYLSAADVTHGLHITQTNVNLMAVPGAVNAARVRFDTPGTYTMVCHEYCGVGHQAMAGTIVVGALPPPAAAAPAAAADAGGAQLFAQKGCIACHSIDGKPGVGPTLKGLLGRREELADGTTQTVDEAFIEEQIRLPTKTLVKGYQPLMPPLPLTDAEVKALVDYVKTL